MLLKRKMSGGAIETIGTVTADPAKYVQQVGSMAELDATLTALPAWSVGDRPRTVRVAAGDYTRSTPIELPSGVTLDLTAGVKITLTDGSDCDIITNADWTGDSDITIVGGYLDGNRLGQTSSAVGDGPGQSLVSLVNVARPVVRGVRGKSPVLHGVDLANTLYHEQGTEPGCTDFLVEDCGFSDFGDDSVTVHQSHGGVIRDCFGYDSAGSYSTSSNAIEIDDGSSDVAVIGGWARNCSRGVQVQGHVSRIAARNVTVTGVVVTDCIYGLTAVAGDPAPVSGFPEGVTFTNCVVTGCDAGVQVNHYGTAEFVGCVFDACTNLISNVAPTDETQTQIIRFSDCQIYATRVVLNVADMGQQVFDGCTFRGFSGSSTVTVTVPDVTLRDCIVTDGISNFSGALAIDATRCRVIGGFYNGGTDGPGIRVSGCVDSIISGARMKGSASAGALYIPSTAVITGLIVTECIATESAVGFNFDLASGTAVVKNNIVKGSTTDIDGAPTGFTIADNLT